MNNQQLLALHVVDHLMGSSNDFHADPRSQTNVLLEKEKNEQATLNLQAPRLTPKRADAREFFGRVYTLKDLIIAYDKAYESRYFERHFAHMMKNVDEYAMHYIEILFNQANLNTSDDEAMLIAKFVSDLDVYSAVKAVESLLNDKVSLALLKLVDSTEHWHMHVDHFALRAGKEGNNDAYELAQMLQEHHGYQLADRKSEQFYQFDDGWSAYVLYKLLDNGQVLRLFVDQSDIGYEKQIIQHWNQVYGYTAHHMAARVTTTISGEHQAVPLEVLMQKLEALGFNTMTPTGLYTKGLLEQVFTVPKVDMQIPHDLIESIKAYDSTLENSIRNAKLLELVSRKEMPTFQAKAWFELMGLEYKAGSKYFSMPIFNYFLPAQAAHVIRTSI